MKSKKSKIITFSILIIAVIFSVIFAVGATDDTSTEYWKSVQMDIANYRKDTGYTAPEYDDSGEWLFAGWFDENGNAVSKDTTTGTYYAKFVPADILGLKAQINVELIDDDATNDEYDENGYNAGAIRFVTSVDTLNYSKIGFKITRGSGDPEYRASNKVYQQLYATGKAGDGEAKTDEYSPSDLFNADASTYFKTWTYTKVPSSAYNMDITVIPYWITLDGTTVTGTTGIKTVNLGRSWVYINTSANADGTEYGTYDHPFTDLADALGAIVLNKNGKIVIQTGATIKPESTFEWTQHGKDLTITGESGTTEALDFSNFAHFKIGDGVTFENMTLTLSTSNFYANGYRFEIAENVVSENSGTVIIGGGNGTDVTSTNVTLLSGSYKAVYGGGLNATVEEDTHVTIRNADVYNSTKGISRVCGGGRNGNVTGSTYVTVGEGFNTELEYTNDSSLSVVSGGGYGSGSEGTATKTATVGKNTYVVIEDGAKANYVYGAGYHYSQVDGTSHVTCDGGLAMSIYGGAAKYGANSSTSVVMKAGTVEQIFGGNESGMTGNTDVRILGGNIMRRVYGGCYNNYTLGWQSTNEVNGYASVTFGPNTYASLATSYSGGDVAYLASSRYNNTVNETGVFIVNDYDVEENPNVSMVGYSTYFDDIKTCNYLVQSTKGGAVYSEGDSLRVIPNENMVATVRVDSAEVQDGTTVHAYITSEGLCKLPALDSIGQRNVYVVFTKETPADVDLDKYEATANGTHYETLEEALSVANTLSTTTETDKAVVVTLLKNAEVEGTLDIVESANIIIQNADNVTPTVNRADGLTSISLLNVAAGAKVTVNGIVLDGRTSSEITAGTTTLTSLTKGSASLVTVSGEAVLTDATIQYTYTSKEGAGVYIADKGKVSMTGGAISNNYTEGSGGAVSVYSGMFTMNDGTISNNTAKKAGGAIIVRTGSTLTMNDGTISDNVTLVSGSNGGGAIFQHKDTTMNINGGTISNNISENDGGAIYVYADGDEPSSLTIKNATLSGNKANHSENGAGGAVYVVENASLILEGGATFQGNTATTNGGAIAVVGNMTEKEGTSCNFAGNKAVNGGAIYVAGTFTMDGANINGNTASGDTDGYGGGVYTTGDGNFAMTGGSITANTAKSNGSGVYVGATGENAAFNMSGGTISEHGTEANPTTFAGNAVYVAANASFIMSGTADISSNYSTKQGNGVCVIAGGSFTMNGGTIQNNHTTDTGSGVATYGSFTMTAGTIKDNSAGKSAGGVIIRNTGSFSMTGGTIENNTAGQNGGGIYIQSNNKTTMEGGTVTNNKATMGGGIFVGAGSGIVFEMSGGTIEKHGTATEPSKALGAGVYVSSGKFSMTGGSIRNNHTTANGAGVYAAKTFNMSGTSEIYGNSTTSDGGGVYVAEGVTYTMNNSAQQTIYDNEAANGGGVAVAGTFNMKKGFIANNTTTTNGGGVYVNGGKFEMTTTDAKTISSNKAGNYGAGVYVNDGTFDMYDGSICNHGEGSATAVTTAGAKEGAGVCAAGTSVVTMTDGSISNNYVSGSGAGVSVRDTAQFVMNGGTISDNTATQSGGGMIVRSTRTEIVEEQEVLVSGFVMNGGTISDNHALVTGKNGGGAIWQAQNTQIELNAGNITQNTSLYGGGGVYVSANTIFILNGAIFTENSADVCGDDIYLVGEITLKKALSDAIVVGTSTYAVGEVIAVNGGITEDEFIASMANITVDAYKGEYWFVNDNGALEAPIVLDGVSYANLDEALENVVEESTITIYQNQELSSPVTIEGTLTITCIDNVSITASESFSGNMFTVAEGGKLVITGDATDKRITLAGRNVAKYGIQSDGTLEITHVVVNNVAQQGVRINKGTATLQGVDIKAFGTYGLVVKNGIVTAKNTLIDNVDITTTTSARIGIAAHGGTLTLDNVTVQNLRGTDSKGKTNNNHGIDHQGGQLIVTANEVVDGGNKGLYIYNVIGHGIYSQGGSMNIAKITIDGNSQTRAGIQLTNNTSDENKVSNAIIEECSVEIQLKNASLWIESTFVEETTNTATNYKTDGTKQ